ncbi:helix-turn-helix domain-containing protein, partial [Streptomyces kaempferi]
MRLREAAGLTQAAVAQALGVRVPSITAWEAGRAEPRGERLEAYRRLLEGLAHRYPAPAPGREDVGPAPTLRPPAATPPGTAAHRTPPQDPETLSAPAPVPTAVPQPEVVKTPAGPSAPDMESVVPVEAPAAPVAAARPARPASSRRPAAWKAAVSPADPRFPHGPLAVLDGDGSAYGVDGIVLDCPASTVPELVEWTLKESGLGAGKLSRYGKDSDPLVV